MESVVDRILGLEWMMFDMVQGISGRSPCQDDEKTFLITRRSHFAILPEAVQQSYLEDLLEADARGHNLLTEKYAYMMEFASPEEFEKIKDYLPAVPDEKRLVVRDIVRCHLAQYEEVCKRYPHVASSGRPATADRDGEETVSIETYMTGELYTYSMRTLLLYTSFMEDAKTSGINVPMRMLEKQAFQQGFSSLDAFDTFLGSTSL
ncbi:MAG: DUF4125 family protein [Clostridiales Family XIII bacterium]|jgi:hypothetical protein|nr:DUF4125 family protein [Clostridiales Family XIII bacterium]